MKSLLVLVLGCSLLSGCLYRHTVEPLMLNMDRTVVGDLKQEREGGLQFISIPTRRSNIPLTAWGMAAIGEAAKRGGMSEVYFADLERLSILTIWNRYTIHIYGK